MSDFTVQVVIPFRDRGKDLRRAANLESVMTWWWAHGFQPLVIDDGLDEDAQFNRHLAYNRAVSRNAADVYVFTEADMILPPQQIVEGARMAQDQTGLVVPFLQYRYLSDEMTGYVRHLMSTLDPKALAEFIATGEIFDLTPETTMDNGRSIGAVNIVSRETLDITGGFTEATSGNWYDDNIIEEGFAYLTGRATRFVEGSAVHLYHLPGWKGDHRTPEDIAATENNKAILKHLRAAISMKANAEVRSILSYRRATA